MRLDYSTQFTDNPEFSALINGSGRRIEFHIAQAERYYYMVALSGRSGKPAVRQKLLGPFFSLEQASGTVRAIGNSLVHTGYERLIGSKPQWTFQVLGELKRLKKEKRKFQGDYAFNPNDVYFD